MKGTIPPKLKKGNHIRVIAPCESFLPKFTKEMKAIGVRRLESLGLEVSFGKYVDEKDDFDTASIEHRLEDLYEAFADPKVHAIIAVTGGSSANQLIDHIDYELLKKNPKIFCGLSDNTELTLAFYQNADLISYYGPHFSMIGASKIIDHSLENMKATFFSSDPIKIAPSKHYINSQWDDELIVNEGFWTINEGEAEGKCLGGNLLTINFAIGHSYMPNFENCILFLEENHVIGHKGIQKELQAILNHPHGKSIKGILIGRFQKKTQMKRKYLTEMIKSKEELENVPVIGNVDLGHTSPIVSFPTGGRLKISAKANDEVSILVTEH